VPLDDVVNLVGHEAGERRVGGVQVDHQAPVNASGSLAIGQVSGVPAFEPFQLLRSAAPKGLAERLLIDG
jgi:hypothetical protein